MLNTLRVGEALRPRMASSAWIRLLAIPLFCFVLSIVPARAALTVDRIELHNVTTSTAFCGGGVILNADLRFVGSGNAGDALNWTIRRRVASRSLGPFDQNVTGNGLDLGAFIATTVATTGLPPLQAGDVIEVFAFWTDNPSVRSISLFARCSGAGPLALLSDVPSDDGNANGLSDPGETLTLTTALAATGTTASAAVLQIPVGIDQSFVEGSLRTTPIARDDNLTAIGNVGTTANLLANDSDPDGRPGLTALATGATTLRGGTYSLAADGELSYDPPLAFSGRDSFAYFIVDADGNRDQGIVTIDVKHLVWFIDQARPANGDGRLSAPFKTLAAFNARQGGGTPADPKAGDHIFLFSGAYDGGLTLLTRQQLIGQGTGLSIGAHVVTSAGLAPTLTNSGGDCLRLARDNRVRGLRISTSAGAGISGQNFGSLTCSSLSVIDVAGPALALTSGSLDLELTTLASLGAVGDGLLLNGIGGSLNVTSATSINNPGADGIRILNCSNAVLNFGAATISGAALDGIDISGSPGAAIGFANVSIATLNGRGIAAAGSGSIHLSGTANTISAEGGAALDLSSMSFGAGATFASVTSANSAAAGIALNSVSGRLTILDGSIGSAAATAFDVDGGGADIHFGGSIVNAAGRAVDIRNRSGGRVTLAGAISCSGTGIKLDNNSGSALIDFAGAVVNLNTGSNTALTMTGNTGAEVRLSGGGLAISTGSGEGLRATAGGTLTVTGGANTITTASARAIAIIDVTIGAGGATFQRVSARNTAIGVALHNAGSGGFAISGTGAIDASGGTFSNLTDRGFEIINTHSITLANISLQNAATTNGADPTDPGSRCGTINTDAISGNNLDCHAPIHLENVLGVQLTNVDIDGSVQQGINGNNVTDLAMRDCVVANIGNQTRETGLRIRDLKGSCLMDNCRISNSFESAAEIKNGAGTMQLVVRNGTIFEDAGNNGLHFECSGAATAAEIYVTGATARNNFATGIHAFVGLTGGLIGGSLKVTVAGCTLQDNNIAVNLAAAGSARATFNVLENGSIGSAVRVNNNASHLINITQDDNSYFDVNVIDNYLDGRDNTVGNGIRVRSDNAGIAEVGRALIEGNTIVNAGNTDGIIVDARDATGAGLGHMHVTVTGNTVKENDPGGTGGSGIQLRTQDFNSMCATVSDNDSGPVDNGRSFRLRATGNSTLSLYQGASASTDPATIVGDNNPASSGVVNISLSGSGVINHTTSQCELPPAP